MMKRGDRSKDREMTGDTKMSKGTEFLCLKI